jgi:predicted transcriptional regulator
MRNVSFKLPEQLDETLTKMARARKATRSSVLREAIEALAKGKRRSVTALADDVVSPLEGPSDLSLNPKHMAGYGK